MVGIMPGTPAKRDEFMDLARLLADPEELEKRKAGYEEAKAKAEKATEEWHRIMDEAATTTARQETLVKDIERREAEIKLIAGRQELFSEYQTKETNRLERMAQHYRSEEARLAEIGTQIRQRELNGEVWQAGLKEREERLERAEAAHHARVAQIEAKIGRVNQAWNS